MARRAWQLAARRSPRREDLAGGRLGREDPQAHADWLPDPDGRDRATCHKASSRSSTAGSAPATSTILVRLAAPVTSVMSRRRTPTAAASAAKAAAVA